MKTKWMSYLIAVLIAIGIAGYGAFTFSPWPWVLMMRHAFNKDVAERNKAFDKFRPDGVLELRDQRYGTSGDALLDVYFPAARADRKALPAIVWLHGGAFVAGNRSDVAGYLRLLAARGYVAVGVGYSLAPSARYPTPVRQANEALAFLASNAGRLGIDPSRLFLAGDSAGAQIAAQLATVISNPSYASAIGISPAVPRAQIKGVILFCGVYDIAAIRPDSPFGDFIRAAMWSYFGVRNIDGDPRLLEFAVGRHITPAFPPAFVSVGNVDPLAPQSQTIAETMKAQGVEVTTLFFPQDYAPPLPHEYQFNMESDAGREALERLGGFIAASAK